MATATVVRTAEEISERIRNTIFNLQEDPAALVIIPQLEGAHYALWRLPDWIDGVE